MSKVDEHRAAFREAEDVDGYLLSNSGLPGPRANLELLRAAVEECTGEDIERWLSHDADAAPVGSREEFLAACGAAALGKLLAGGDVSALPRLRACANDSRWRTREGVAMALQRWGAPEPTAMLDAAQEWASGTRLEQRSAVAGPCEPSLLRDPDFARRTLDILDVVTESIVGAKDRRSDDFHALRKGLGYCWSVAVAAIPDEGKSRMERWCAIRTSGGPDVRWVMRENLKKNRLKKLDPEWAAESLKRL